jgi:hypothetical protein
MLPQEGISLLQTIIIILGFMRRLSELLKEDILYLDSL